MEKFEKELEIESRKIIELELKRNQLNEKIRQARVDENNLRNRFLTFESIKNSKQSGNKVKIIT